MIVASDLSWLWWTVPSYVIALCVLVVGIALYRRGKVH